MQNAFIIFRKELRAHFDHPTAYIVLGVFVLLWEFLFFQSAFLVGEASVRILFGMLPWLLIFVVPAITMGSISQEKADGTLELLMTHPLKDIELLVGKCLANLAFVAFALLLVFPIALSFSGFGHIDWGVVMGQYLASLCLAMVLVTLGVFFSSLCSSPISSLLVSASATFLLVIVGSEFVTASVPSFFAQIFEQLSVVTHFTSMERGVVDVRDLWYTLSAVAIFLGLAYVQLRKRKVGNRPEIYRRYRIGTALIIGIALLTNMLGSRIPGRFDLTEGQLYTVTGTTRSILGGLGDVVTLTLYASDQLPAQLQPVLRDVKDILRDYETYGKGNILVLSKNTTDPTVAQEAFSSGIQQAQFNVVGQGEFSVQTGTLGIVASYASQHEVIPFVQNTTDLEYQLTSIIKKLSTKQKKTIAFLTQHGEKSSQDLRTLVAELSKQYHIEDLVIGKEMTTIPRTLAALVIAGPMTSIDERTQAMIRTYLDEGGSALLLVEPVTVNMQTLGATVNPVSFDTFASEYGVSFQPNLVYDVRSNETVNFSGGGQGQFISFMLPYPFWARVQPSDRSSPITSRIEGVVLPWASSVALQDDKISSKKITASRLLVTSRFGGTQVGTFSLSPQQQLPRDHLGEQLVAVALEQMPTSAENKASSLSSGMRMVVVSNVAFLTDQFLQKSPQNLAFGMGAISWLARDESLANIQLKQQVEHKLIFANGTQIALVKYGNMLLVLLTLCGIGLSRFLRRRNLRHQPYSSFAV